MPEVPDGLRDIAERVGVGALLDVLLISLAIYWLLLLLRGTTAMTVLRGVSLLLLGAFLLARTFDLQVVNWMLERTITGLVIGIVIVFHPEIRRALERLGRTCWRPSLVRAEQERGIEQVVRSAAQRLRPVLLTATTTVFGLLPLASHLSVDFIERSIVYGGQLSGFWVPLAQAIVSGLTVATVLTLVATPAMLALPHTPWAKAAGGAALALARAPRLAWQALAARQPKPFTNTIR